MTFNVDRRLGHKLDKSGGTVSGDLAISGSLSITGTATVDGASIKPPIEFNVEGPYTVGGSVQTGVMVYRVMSAGTLKSATLTSKTAGTSGALTIDLLRSSDSGATWNSIFQTTPTLSYLSGSYSSNNGSIVSAGVNLAVGDLIRLDISSVQVGGIGFVVQLFYS